MTSDNRSEPERIKLSETVVQNNTLPENSAKITSQSSRRMYCIARWCGNSSKNNDISLFRLPRDRERSLLWLKNADREDLQVLSCQVLHTRYLCMDHFTDDMFMNSCKKKLVWNAVPVHFPKPKCMFKEETHTHNSLQSTIVLPAQLSLIPESHSFSNQRPIKPKPLNLDHKPTIESGNNESEYPGMSKVQKSKMKNCAANVVTSVRCNDASAMFSLPSKKVKNLNPTGTSKSSTNLSNITDFKQINPFLSKITCHPSSMSNVDAAKKLEIHVSSDEKNSTSESDSFVNDECDTESICLEHAKERIYPCRYCGEMFLVKSNLILHQTTYHSDRPVGCDLCGRVLYKSKSEFMEHVCEHHTDNIT